MTDTSFLSVRVPAELHSRMKRLAAGRRTSVQALVRDALEGYLHEHDRTPPDLGQTIATLRAHEAELRSSGIEHLYVFGSIVRGEARGDSDVDLAIDVREDDDQFSVITLASINARNTCFDQRADGGMAGAFGRSGRAIDAPAGAGVGVRPRCRSRLLKSANAAFFHSAIEGHRPSDP